MLREETGLVAGTRSERILKTHLRILVFPEGKLELIGILTLQRE